MLLMNFCEVLSPVHSPKIAQILRLADGRESVASGHCSYERFLLT
jgi:hypothetical protein